ncbi:MAG: hypothetical protein H6R18_2104 [Proteobacteria bacterium]|nr:hypothetical protein [Pseudomonadota bacterium]
MGLGDWFSGNKKAKFREELKDAVGQGKLTDKKMAELEEVRRRLEVSAADDDKTKFRREVFETAVSAVRAGGQLTEKEAAELAKIQKYLGLRDDQIAESQAELVRLRQITEIAEGRFPVITQGNIGLRGVQLEAGETAHYCVSAELLEGDVGNGEKGARFPWNMTYPLGLGKGKTIPSAGTNSLGSGYLIITDRRVILRTDNRFVDFKFREPEIFVYQNGFRFELGKRTFFVKSRTNDVNDMAGMLLSKLMA